MFLIVNPVVAIVAYEYVARSEHIDPKDVELVFVRGQSYKLFDGFSSHMITKTVFNRAARRLPFFRSYPESVRALIESFSVQFILYASWLDPVASEVIQSNNCLTHCYLEEGEQSYKDLAVVPNTKDYRPPFKTGSKKYRYDHYWRDDAQKWIGTQKGVFPSAPNDKILLLEDFSFVKQKYKPSLQHGDVVLLLPTPGRLPKSEWKNAIRQLRSNSISSQSFLKLHPGYYENPVTLRKIKKILNSSEFSDLVLLSGEVILEAEMLFNKLIIVGDRSSVFLYTMKLGSQFVEVPFIFGEPY